MNKKIGIDMREMKAFSTGIGNHYINLLHSLIVKYSHYDYYLIINKRGEKYIKNAFINCHVTYLFIPINGGSFKQYFSFVSLYKKYYNFHFDLLITDPWSALLFTPSPYLLMVYDLIGFHKLVKLSLKQRLFDKFLFRYIVNRAAGMIASSRSVKADLSNYLNAKSDLIYIVQPSVSREYLEQSQDAASINLFYHLPDKYIVYIGNRRPHKNLLGALEIFSQLAKTHKSLYFVIIGGFDTEKINQHDELKEAIAIKYTSIKDKIIFLGKVPSNNDVRAILHGAICLLHPTLFEGYGLTPLEAMHAKTCVVASDIDPIREVIGSAGQLFPYNNTGQFVEAINALIVNPILRNEYIEKGLTQSKEITWEKAAYNLEQAIQKTLRK